MIRKPPPAPTKPVTAPTMRPSRPIMRNLNLGGSSFFTISLFLVLIIESEATTIKTANKSMMSSDFVNISDPTVAISFGKLGITNDLIK